MGDRVFNVLFLCTGNSARGIFAEALLNQLGQGKFRAFSAGSHPRGHLHPYAVELLRSLDLETDGMRSKSWQEFAHRGAPEMDLIFTVSDEAAHEPVPEWPGKPVTAHWGVPNPTLAQGDEMAVRKAFRDAFRLLEARIKLLAALPVEGLDRLALKTRLDTIGRHAAEAEDRGSRPEARG